MIAGRAHVFGEDVNTDYIISARRKESHAEIRELVPFLMEDVDPGFAARVEPGDVIVAGRNFGCGSSREAAPAVIAEAGIAAVLAPSFARIFFRNAINIGLPIVTVDTAEIADGEVVEVDVGAGLVRVPARGLELSAAPLPPFLLRILSDGGLIEHLRRHGDFRLDDPAGAPA